MTAVATSLACFHRWLPVERLLLGSPILEMEEQLYGTDGGMGRCRERDGCDGEHGG